MLIIALLLIAILGYLAQTTGLCMVRGVNEAFLLGKGKCKPQFLLAILLSGSLAWIAYLLALFLDLPLNLKSYSFSLLAALGGLLFGIGAAFNAGCGVSTISKLARGQSSMLATIIGWFIGWLLLSNLQLTLPAHTMTLPPTLHFGALALLSAGLLVWIIKVRTTNRTMWLSMLAIGLMASLVFLYEVKWTPSSVLKDMSHSLLLGDGLIWPEQHRFMLIAALITGMVLAAVITQSFNPTFDTARGYLRHLAAGILMGVGAALAGGGNDSQLLLALPALSPAGITSVAFIIIGIYASKRWLKA